MICLLRHLALELGSRVAGWAIAFGASLLCGAVTGIPVCGCEFVLLPFPTFLGSSGAPEPMERRIFTNSTCLLSWLRFFPPPPRLIGCNVKLEALWLPWESDSLWACGWWRDTGAGEKLEHKFICACPCSPYCYWELEHVYFLMRKKVE